MKLFLCLATALVFSAECLSADPFEQFCTDRTAIAISNALGYRQVDFLIVETSFKAESGLSNLNTGRKQSADQQIDENKRFIRCVMDFEKQEAFCFVRIVLAVRPEKVGGKSNEEEKQILHLAVRGNGICKSGQYPRGVRASSATSIHKLFQIEVDVPDLRFVSLAKYSETQLRSSEFLNLDEINLQKISGSSNTKTSLRRTSQSITTAHTNNSFTGTVEFDCRTLMPVRMTGRLMPNGLVVSDELISWLEKDGVCLPTEVSSEETSVETGETRFSSAKIYWRSFNEPISTLFFNSSFLTDTKQLLKSVDEETFIADGVLNGS